MAVACIQYQHALHYIAAERHGGRAAKAVVSRVVGRAQSEIAALAKHIEKILRILGDKIDHPGQAITTVHRGGWATQDFNPLIKISVCVGTSASEQRTLTERTW